MARASPAFLQCCLQKMSALVHALRLPPKLFLRFCIDRRGTRLKKILLLESLLLAGGFVFGLIAYACLPEDEVFRLQQTFLTQLEGMAATLTLQDTAARVFRANFLDMVRFYLAGVCLLGLPVLALLLFQKGFTFGFTLCFLLAQSPLLACSRVLFYPVLLIAAIYSCRFSLLLVQNRLSSPARQLLQYTIRFGLLLLVVLAISYVDGLSCYHVLQSAL